MSQDKLKLKPIPTRKYICCPFCSATLLQAELARNIVVKCDKCHRMISVEVESERIEVKLHITDYETK